MVAPVTPNVPPTLTLLLNFAVLVTSTFCPVLAVSVRLLPLAVPVIVLLSIVIVGNINGLAAVILPELTVPKVAVPVIL